MKRYIRSANENGRRTADVWNFGKRVATAYIDILGKTLGDMTVFRITATRKDESSSETYWVGKDAPSDGDNLGLLSELAANLEHLLGVDPNTYISDVDVVDAVDDSLSIILEHPKSQAVMNYLYSLGVDPMAEPWRARTNSWGITINIAHYCSVVVKDGDISDASFSLSDEMMFKMLESNDGEVDPNYIYNVPEDTLDFYRNRIARKREMEEAKKQPYPDNIDDNLAEAMHELITFIREGSNKYDDLYDLKSYVESRSVNNKRSQRYQDSKVQTQIDELFEWADSRNLSPTQLKSMCNKVYKTYLTKHRDARY